MKKLLLLTLVCILALAAPIGCSCNETVQSAPSTPSVVTPSVTSSAVTSTVSYTSYKYELEAMKTTDWIKYKSLSDKLYARFAVYCITDWTRSAGAETVFLDAAGQPVMEVLNPVKLTGDQTLPEKPGDGDPAYGAILSASDVTLANMRGKLLVRQLDDGRYLYQYFMRDSEIVYRVNFYSADNSETDRTLFNTLIDMLATGK